MKKFFLSLIVASIVSFSFIGCSENVTETPVSSDNTILSVLEKRPGNGQTIVDIAAGNQSFTYLVAAVQFAGLVDVLNGNRQFTVFAPTDAAFKALSDALGLENVSDLLVESNKELVTNVLLYHVSPGNKSSQNVVKSGKVNTLLGEFAYSRVEDGFAQIGNETNGFANIIAVDIRATNGTIHVLDKVLLP